MVVLEELASAEARGATIYAEVIGLGSANVADKNLRGKCDMALERAMQAALRDAGRSKADVGHINAHGLSTPQRDADEARAEGLVDHRHQLFHVHGALIHAAGQ